MPKLSIEIPDEIMNLIEADGYDLHSYFYLVFMRPLLERHQVSLENEVVAKAKKEIDDKIEEVKGLVIVEIEKDVIELKPTPEPDANPESTESSVEDGAGSSTQ